MGGLVDAGIQRSQVLPDGEVEHTARARRPPRFAKPIRHRVRHGVAGAAVLWLRGHASATDSLIQVSPGVVIDGKVVHAGGVPGRDKVEQWLSA